MAMMQHNNASYILWYSSEYYCLPTLKLSIYLSVAEDNRILVMLNIKKFNEGRSIGQWTMLILQHIGLAEIFTTYRGCWVLYRVEESEVIKGMFAPFRGDSSWYSAGLLLGNCEIICLKGLPPSFFYMIMYPPHCIF